MNVLNGRGADAMKSQRYVFVYVLNVLSCFAVVVLHTTLPVYTRGASFESERETVAGASPKVSARS